MGEVNLIIVRLKYMRKSERIVLLVRVDSKSGASYEIFNVVLVVFNICSDSMPAQVFSLA